MEGIIIDRELQQMLNTENLWLNVIITHPKFISTSPFILLIFNIYYSIFSIFLPPIWQQYS